MAVTTTTTEKATTPMNNDADDDDDDDDDKGVQIRISFHLATEYQTVLTSLHVPNDIIAVPADIHRKGLSTIINHLLDRHDPNDDDDDHDKLPTIPFEFMIGSSSSNNNNSNNSSSGKNHSTATGHRLLRSTGGMEREVRKLGLSLEEAIPVTYFPAQLPPEPSSTDQEPTLPDWIGTMECIHITANEQNVSSSSSLLCTGCYDGSIVVLDASARTTNSDNPNNSAIDVPLSIMTTKPLAHDGPIHCLSTAQMNDDILIVSGSMDHTLRIHTLSSKQTGSSPLSYDFDENRTVDCGRNGHTAAITSVDTISSTGNESDPTTAIVYIASGDYDGNVGIWEYQHNHNQNDNEEEDDHEAQPSSTKKSKSVTLRKGTTSDGTSTTVTKMKTIAAKRMFRAHTTQVSGIAFGNYEKVQSSSSSSSLLLFIPQQLITGSWDHSIKVWDLVRQENISTINGQRVITCLDTSYHTSGIVVTGHPDCTIRLWDTRSTTSSSTTSSSKDASSSSLTVSDTTFQPSHKEWVSGVQWSPTNPYHVVSTSYDGTMKLWDIRSSLPLYTVRTFPTKEKGLSVCYSSSRPINNSENVNFLFAGGTDCMVKKYKLF